MNNPLHTCRPRRSDQRDDREISDLAEYVADVLRRLFTELNGVHVVYNQILTLGNHNLPPF